MRIKQKSVRSFEIFADELSPLKEFVEKKFEQLKNYPIYVQTDKEEIKEYLSSTGLEIFYTSVGFESSNKKIELDFQKDKKDDIIRENLVEKFVKSKTKIYKRVIRGGEEIISDDNLVFLNRINSGAKVVSSGNIELFCEVDGFVECNGDYMIIKEKPKGIVLFRGDKVENIKSLSLIDEDGVREIL